MLDDLTALGKFDVVFCRNVSIYFDQETKCKVLDRITKLLPPDGVVFLGGAETVLGITDKLKPLAGLRGVYCLSDGEGIPLVPAALRPTFGATLSIQIKKPKMLSFSSHRLRFCIWIA